MRSGRHVKKEVLLLTDGLYNCGDDSEVVAASDALKQVADIYGVLSVLLRYTNSDYLCGIFKLFLAK
jgi:hypothetical protein